MLEVTDAAHRRLTEYFEGRENEISPIRVFLNEGG